ncbi:MAG: GNVR domain-containing protein, partial [candidate division Zixibacteria bacterium]|nr:GNVR domain-containing protein [candidate division Zixibacteria bacterium]
RRRRFIVGFILTATVVALVLAFVLPKWYRAKTSILPSQYDQSLGISGNFAQYALSSSGFELPIMATPSDVYATMLKSEAIVRAVVDDNKLLPYLKEDSFQKAYEYMRDMTQIKITGEGVVELYFEDKNPQMAAQIANSYIKCLDQLNREVKAGKAKADKEFILHRLNATKASLDSARTQLLAFQTEYKAVDLDQQKGMALAAATQLKSRLTVTQVTLDIKKNVYSEDHPEVRRLQTEVNELQRQLNLIESGGGKTSYFSLGLAEMPYLAGRYTELKANVDIQTRVYDLLTGMLEEARIKEQKDTPTISVLETAYPPELKYRPKRTLIVVLTFAASIVLSFFIALFADYLENLRRSSPSEYDLLQQTRNELTGKRGFPDS